MIRSVQEKLKKFSVAAFIAKRNIMRGSKMVTLVTVFILMLTFLNLMFVGGLLLGIMDGIIKASRLSFIGDVFIVPSKDNTIIKNPQELLTIVKNDPRVISYSPRLTSPIAVESGYQVVRPNRKVNRVTLSLVGVDPMRELETTNIEKHILAGRMLRPGDQGKIMLSAQFLKGYIPGSAFSALEDNLGEVKIGQKVRVRFANGTIDELELVGVFNTKPFGANMRAFVPYTYLSQKLGKQNQYNEISVLTDPLHAHEVYIQLKNHPVNKNNLLSDIEGSLGTITGDFQKSFGMIGNIVGAVSVMVAAVTIFIIIFVNVINRRRYLGIAKALGVTQEVLILAYVMQSLFYAAAGILVGLLLLQFFLIPFFITHPLPFPIADVSLYFPRFYISVRIIILVVVALVSGFIPARMVIRQSTIDAILGR